MITQIKTKVEVGTDLFNPLIKNIIYCKIENFIQDVEGYRINGGYFYKKENEQEDEEQEKTYTDIPLKNFSRTFTNEELDALFSALNINYPEGATYTEKRVKELLTGLRYIVAAEPILGLTGNDWE